MDISQISGDNYNITGIVDISGDNYTIREIVARFLVITTT